MDGMSHPCFCLFYNTGGHVPLQDMLYGSGCMSFWCVSDLSRDFDRKFKQISKCDNKCKDHCKCNLCRCCSVCEATCKCTGAIRPLERYYPTLWAFVHDSEESPEKILNNLLPDGFVRLLEIKGHLRGH